MKNILIICEAGVSASLLLYKLVQEIEKNKLEYNVDYASILRVEMKLNSENYDSLVFTPQVRRYEDKVRGIMKQNDCHASMVFLTDEEFNYLNVSEILKRIKQKI